MLSSGLILTVAGSYLGLIFLLAFLAEKWHAKGRLKLLQSPVIYTLSLAVYCTSWTFYGAVGSAARDGLEYLTIYLGPTVILMAWWFLLRKLIRISKSQRITSIADFLSARYGKSSAISAVVTIIALIGVTPYIALQLKAVAASFDALSLSHAWQTPPRESKGLFGDTGFWVAVSMAIFVILFGTRNLDADEHHPGIVAAIAFESVVKILALGIIAFFAVYGWHDDLASLFENARWNEAATHLYHFSDGFEPRWLATFFLAAAAFLCLPRQFQVMVVENQNERHLHTASWLFPLYLMLISMFVIPIAIGGLTQLPASVNPDLYVLALPLSTGHEGLAMIAFIGGLSAATSMVIVATIALSIMISNHLVTPILLQRPRFAQNNKADYSGTLLLVRRMSILAIMGLGFVYYYWIGTQNPLASIGLISFAGVAQFLPALIGGIFWHGATKSGALAGLIGGFFVWAYTLILPGFAASGWAFANIVTDGPFGVALLKPSGLFGFEDWDPLVHGLFLSLSMNVFLFILVSLGTIQNPLERIQSLQFVGAFKRHRQNLEYELERSASMEDLLNITQRVIGPVRARNLFDSYINPDGSVGRPPLPDARFIAYIERELAGKVGAASARTLVSRVSKGDMISLDAIIHILDETQAVIQYSHELELKSKELEDTATQLRTANAQLTRLDRMKDDFLSQVSHELRTPMTSIRSFSEILMSDQDIKRETRERFLTIIHKESIRLTGLLDEILDLAQLEEREADWELEACDLNLMIEDAIQTMQGLAKSKSVQITTKPYPAKALVMAHPDRLKQVIINLLSNAIKYNTKPNPRVDVSISQAGQTFFIRIQDNGPGIPPEDRVTLFSKFSRGWQSKKGTRDGAGLGLAISKRIMTLLDGDLYLEDGQITGTCFTLCLKANMP